MNHKDALKNYRDKRTGNSPEPKGEGSDEAGPSQDLQGGRFVIQQHSASSMHYDFRLEVNGVLKSWAVPKGPSTDPRDKRLAVPTEDHPLEYADFEGVIPQGEYGAGAVIIWDAGTYENRSEIEGEPVSMYDALVGGHAAFFLKGEKLQGGYALNRMQDDEEARWLLVKMKDEYADARRNPVNTEPASIVSGQTVEDMAHTMETDS